MAINTSKVIVGGLVAGAVANVIDFAVQGYLLVDMQKAALDALNPTLAASAMQSSKIPVFVALDFVWGFAVVWLYAAIRPRFGPGVRTAAIAGVMSWLLGATSIAFFAAMGLFTWSFFAIGAACALINAIITTIAGAKFYTEGASAPGTVGHTAYSA